MCLHLVWFLILKLLTESAKLRIPGRGQHSLAEGLH